MTAGVLVGSALLNRQLAKKAERDNPPTREQGTDRPGRSSASVGVARSAMEETDWHDIAEERFAGGHGLRVGRGGGRIEYQLLRRRNDEAYLNAFDAQRLPDRPDGAVLRLQARQQRQFPR